MLLSTPAPPNAPYSATEPVLFVACELSETTWKLGFTMGHGPNPRTRPMGARAPQRRRAEVAQAHARVGAMARGGEGWRCLAGGT